MHWMKRLQKKEAKERAHRAVFAEYLKNQIRKHQERLDADDFEDEDEAVHLTQHVQRLRRIIDELEQENMQGQGIQERSAM